MYSKQSTYKGPLHWSQACFWPKCCLLLSTRAGHFRYFLILSILKNDFFAFFIKLITNICTSPILKAHSQSYELDKTCKKYFFIIEKIKKYRKCPALYVNVKLSILRAAIKVPLTAYTCLNVAPWHNVQISAQDLTWWYDFADDPMPKFFPHQMPTFKLSSQGCITNYAGLEMNEKSPRVAKL